MQEISHPVGQSCDQAIAAVIEEAVLTRWERQTGNRPRRCKVLLGGGCVRALVGALAPLGEEPAVLALSEVHERIGLQIGLASAGVVSAQLDSPVVGIGSTVSSAADELIIFWELSMRDSSFGDGGRDGGQP